MSKTLLVQRSIIDSYRDDISKYAGQEKARAKLFFDAIPSELSKEKKRFIIADIEQRATAQKYENAAQWLMDAGIAYFSYNTHNLLLPFEQYEKRNLYKVFLLDTGLLCSMWREPIQWQVLNGEIDINEGALTENFVATELVKKGYVLHYYDHKSRQELDFLVAQNNKINIIEVKSGNDYKRHASLDAVLESPNPTLGDLMVISKFPMQKIGDIQYIPLYALGCIILQKAVFQIRFTAFSLYANRSNARISSCTHRPMTVKRLRRTAECPVDSQGVSAPREFAERT